MNNAVSTVNHAESQETPVSASAAIIQVIERAAANPNIDVEKMERLLAMQERVLERHAKAAFIEAFAQMKPALPVIDRKGRIEVRKKDAHGERTGPVQQSTAFARWEDIDEAITPILCEYGFVLSFRTSATSDGRIVVTAVLSHREGHEEQTSLPPLPFDTTGSKNNVQAVGSSLSYGKRYAATLLLNIRTRGEDDDGEAANIVNCITEEQIGELQALIDSVGADKAKFLAYLKVQSLADIPSAKFKGAVEALNAKGRGK